MRILIADDDLITLMALEKCLRDWGYEVETARSGQEAWEKLQQDQSFQILILDWMMPDLDGIALARKIKTELTGENQPLRHIIVLSGTDGYENIIRGLSSGADDYLVKPYSFNELRVRVKRAEKMLQVEEEKRRLLSLDPLTRLWNRQKILEFLEEEIARGLRNFHPTGILLLSPLLPNPAPDTSFSPELEKSILIEMAKQLKEKLRCYDKVGRFSRREFLVILPQTSSDDLRHVANRLSENIVLEAFAQSFMTPVKKIAFGGVATDLLAHPSVEAMITAAKKALAIALHVRYPEPAYIIKKKEVIDYDRGTDHS